MHKGCIADLLENIPTRLTHDFPLEGCGKLSRTMETLRKSKRKRQCEKKRVAKEAVLECQVSGFVRSALLFWWNLPVHR